MTGPELVVVGSANADLVTAVDRHPAPGETVLGSDLAVHPGGKGANQAVAAARLGARTGLLARVGDDAYGRLLRESLATAGVDTGAVRTGGAPTGVALIAVGSTGDNTIVVAPGANHRLSPEDVAAAGALLAAAGAVSLQLEIPPETVTAAVRTAVAAGTRVVLNASPPAPLSAEVLAACDPLVVNEHEARRLLAELPAGAENPPGAEGAPGPPGGHEAGAGDARAAEHRPLPGTGPEPGSGPAAEPAPTGPAEAVAGVRALLALGPRSVVVTLGARGALAAERGGPVRQVPSPAVTAVDTTGAGDAFTGALAWRLCRGDSLETATRFAVRVGAAAVTRAGAQDSFPGPGALPPEPPAPG
ncbi:ribokinase [Streptomyces sp. JJ36]|uniref:ribokinase n=1 Tax=Streptomyces sp. JJ36 TaxID=2736645 RepID=UPI001F30AA5E|nr:ribokinase [Streptomyces sp. JJ36]MCF6523730.1 ribokinase [Streptomyces sp. JJ36]